jgi:hypothetical protein
MGRKFGFSFSWKRALGISGAKARISRMIGIPLTRSGRERKIGRMVTGGRCFVATACCGDAEHPTVRVLLRFRDEYLRRHPAGRMFIAWYYRHGPALAALIERAGFLRCASRAVLSVFAGLVMRTARRLDRRTDRPGLQPRGETDARPPPN